jgi:hypothetical protein
LMLHLQMNLPVRQDQRAYHHYSPVQHYLRMLNHFNFNCLPFWRFTTF